MKQCNNGLTLIKVLMLVSLLFPQFASSASLTDYGWDCQGFLKCGSGGDAIEEITTRVIVGIYDVIVAAAVISFLWGGIKLASSQGGEGKEAGKKAIIWSSVGLALAALTYAGGGANRIVKYVYDLIFAIS